MGTAWLCGCGLAWWVWLLEDATCCLSRWSSSSIACILAERERERERERETHSLCGKPLMRETLSGLPRASSNVSLCWLSVSPAAMVEDPSLPLSSTRLASRSRSPPLRFSSSSSLENPAAHRSDAHTHTHALRVVQRQPSPTVSISRIHRKISTTNFGENWRGFPAKGNLYAHAQNRTTLRMCTHSPKWLRRQWWVVECLRLSD